MPPTRSDEPAARSTCPGCLEPQRELRFPRVLASARPSCQRGSRRPPPRARARRRSWSACGSRTPPATRVGVGEQFWEPDTVVMYAARAYGQATPHGALTGEAAAFLQSGCAVVVCGVRGGGEQGPAWHAAGRLESKAAAGRPTPFCSTFGSRTGTSSLGTLCRRA